MKTINKDIQYFTTETSARKYFNKIEESCQLLTSKTYGGFYVDISKKAIIDWPRNYTIISEK